MRRWHLGYLIAALAVFGPGCASLPYQYGKFQTSPPQEVVVRYGEPGPRLQRARRFVSAPARLFHLPERKTPSPETLDKLKAYLRQNDLTDVPVYVNCYEPKEQWRRLRENQSIAAGWRYTAGALGVLGYTLLPGPVFRRDSYSAYTNTINLNADGAAIALSEAAGAKDLHEQKMPGTYLAVNSLPVVGLWRQCRIASDLTSYAQEQKDWELERATYRHVYPRLGSEGMGAATLVVATAWWKSPIFNLAGAGAGFATGRTVEAIRERQIKSDIVPKSDLALKPDIVPIGTEAVGEIQLTGAIERLPATEEILSR
jgi:hypothetical protein